MLVVVVCDPVQGVSHPARGAWIEIVHLTADTSTQTVAPRKGCVD